MLKGIADFELQNYVQAIEHFQNATKFHELYIT